MAVLPGEIRRERALDRERRAGENVDVGARIATRAAARDEDDVAVLARPDGAGARRDRKHRCEHPKRNFPSPTHEKAPYSSKAIGSCVNEKSTFEPGCD